MNPGQWNLRLKSQVGIGAVPLASTYQLGFAQPVAVVDFGYVGGPRAIHHLVFELVLNHDPQGFVVLHSHVKIGFRA